jgi:hypothetical protein
MEGALMPPTDDLRAKLGFPYIDGRIPGDLKFILNGEQFRLWGAMDDTDGEIRLRIRRIGRTYERQREVEICLDDNMAVCGMTTYQT